MRADELMIGDWVLDTGGVPFQVKELLEDGINGEWDGGECYGAEAGKAYFVIKLGERLC